MDLFTLNINPLGLLGLDTWARKSVYSFIDIEALNPFSHVINFWPKVAYRLVYVVIETNSIRSIKRA